MDEHIGFYGAGNWPVFCAVTFLQPLGLLAALAYWALGWAALATCETPEGKRAAREIVNTAQNWMSAWAMLGGLAVVIAVYRLVT